MQKPIPVIQSNLLDLNRIQQYIKQAFSQISDNPLLNGLVLPILNDSGQVVPFSLYGATVTALNLVNASNPAEIYHNLGRPLTGWIVIGSSASSTFWDSQSSNTVANGYSGIDKSLLLNVSADTTAKLYVF